MEMGPLVVRRTPTSLLLHAVGRQGRRRLARKFAKDLVGM